MTRPTLQAVGIDSPLAEAAPAAPEQPTAKPRRKRTAPASRESSRTPGEPTPNPKPNPDPYAGVPKVSVNMKLLQTLWEQLGANARALEELGLRTNRTELVEAMLHRELPATPDELAELVRAFRRARAG